MARIHKINSRLKAEINTGFGINSSDYGGRFLNKDGTANLEKQGVGILERTSWYHTLLSLSRWKFLSVILVFYLTVNLFFAAVYYFIGIEKLGGIITKSPIEEFGEAFFFSCQTFTTVGYGRISPVGFLASSVSALEALIGLLSLAVVTGLLYGRFSRPKAYLRFSENAILAPYQGITAIMLRVAPFKNTILTDAEAKVTLGLVVEENGKMVNKFFQLPLEFSSINSLTLSWTLVHPITEDSPFYNFIEEDYKNIKGEIIVFIKAFDDMFSNVVVSRTSYIFNEIIIGAKFNPMYTKSDTGNKTILYLDRLNSFNKVAVNFNIEKEKVVG
jgi:inward rectifier potassium channel